MRYLAIARYRFLLALRGATWLFVFSIIAAAFFVERTGLLYERSSYVSKPDAMLPMGASLVVATYFVHICMLLGACYTFGAVKKGAQNAGTADLIETAPILPRHRFLGDGLGIFAAVMMIHICTLPLLALQIAFSPYATNFLLYAELTILVLTIFASASSSWRLRAENFRWSYARGFRSQAIFMILFFLTIWLNTRSFVGFFDAAVWVVFQPSPHGFARVAETFNDPVLIFSSLAFLFGGFLCFFYLHAVRSLQQR